MSLLSILKSYLSPKSLLAKAIDSLDLLVTPLAEEIESQKRKFNALDSFDKAQYLVDKVQDFLRKKFNLPLDD